MRQKGIRELEKSQAAMLGRCRSAGPRILSSREAFLRRLHRISSSSRAKGIVCLLGLLLASCNAHSLSPEGSYVRAVTALVRAHRDGLQRLLEPADKTATALIAGGSFYLGGDPGWIAEANGRAGGLIMVRPLPTATPGANSSPKSQPTVPAPGTWLSASAKPGKGDVVWIAYSPADYSQNAQMATDLERRGCVVVLFGPNISGDRPKFVNWIDSLTSQNDDPNFTRMGNILSLWTATAEVAASTSRKGKTLAFFESDSIEGARVRNALYGTLHFHDGIPSMAPIAPGTLSREYITYVQTMLQEIYASERDKIHAVGSELQHQAAEGHPGVLMLIGHMMPYAVDHNSTQFRYMSYPAERENLQSHLPPHGYFVFLGYVGVPLDLWRQVRAAGAKAVWVESPLPTAVDFHQWDDVVVDEHWLIGDCAVSVPGYDIRILPPSGISQLFIYGLLVRAAISPSGS